MDKKIKRFHLRTETLRALSDSDLNQAAGGYTGVACTVVVASVLVCSVVYQTVTLAREAKPAKPEKELLPV